VQRDVLDLASSVYLADRHIPRERGVDAGRNVAISIALREPDSFDPAALSSLLNYLAADSVSFRIHHRTERDTGAEAQSSPGRADQDVVCLLSGGADSFGGAIDACESGLSPAIIGHYTSDSTHQSKLADAIQRHYKRNMARCFVGSLQTPGGGLAKNPADPSMRLRSFLYLSLATTIAASSGIDEVRMSENGIMTPGIPFAPSRVGPYTTRTTHPVFVENFCKWYGSLADGPVQVLNPFAYMTKSEILTQIDARGFGKKLRETVSCFRRQYAMRWHSDHCGVCVPCLLRRAAFIHSGLEAYDARKGYVADFLDLDNLPEIGRVDLFDVAAFSTDFSEMSDNDLTFKYVELLRLVDPDRIAKTVQTLRRFSREFLEVLQDRAAANLKVALGIR
jgi:hypothetical protein